MARPAKAPKSQKKQLIIGIGAMVLALCMAVPRLMGPGNDGTIVDVDEPWLDEADAYEGSANLEFMEGDDLAIAADDAGEENVRRGPRLVADLLADHGSYAGTTPLPNPFWQPPAPVVVPETPAEPEVPVELVKAPDPAPEVDSEDESEEKPLPQHLVSLVYLTDDVLRAVMDGRVVGVGDQVDAGLVKAIRMNGVLVSTTRGTVLYALGTAEPVLPTSGRGGSPWDATKSNEASDDD